VQYKNQYREATYKKKGTKMKIRIEKQRYLIILAMIIGLLLSACGRTNANAVAMLPVDGLPVIQVQTLDGPVQGRVADGIAIYKGIPYAKAPVGEGRFAPPEDVVPWTGLLDCTEFGAVAVQDVAPAGLTMSEDCLSLNIWTPSNANTAANISNRPVYVWIHGGGFTIGSGAEPQYDGTNFAREGIVTVTINYRLNGLGFLASRQTYDEYGTTGNWGLLDQIKALEWIKENIGAFGGDNKNITIGGESAGAYSVSALITSPLTEGLFQRAIMESGSILGVPGNHYYSQGNLERSILRDSMLAYTFGATDDAMGLAALRAVDAGLFAQMTPFIPDFTVTPAFMMTPVFDGYVNPVDVYGALQAGDFHKVDLLWGYNADEGSIFVPETTDQPTYGMMAARMYGDEKSRQVLARFPIDAEHTSGQRTRELLAYGMFSAVMKPYADALAQSGQAVYAYRFNYVTAENETNRLGAHHGSEIEYAFGNLPAGADDEQRALSGEMFTRWVNFIKTGDPNIGGGTPSGVAWPPYDAQDNWMLLLDKEVTAAKMPGKEEMEFMEQIMFGVSD
jgi:para-nitrobenzyl esterase